MIHRTRLRVVIPTRGRADWDKQSALRQLLAAAVPVTLVVPKRETRKYRHLLFDRGRGLGLVKVRPCVAKGLAKTRRWITRRMQWHGRVIMFDDDSLLVAPDGTPLGPREIRLALYQARLALRHNIMVGFGLAPFTAVYGFNLGLMRAAHVCYGRVNFHDHIDIQLQLLQRGIQPVVVPVPAATHSGLLRNGGMADYMTQSMRGVATRQLRKLYPEHIVFTEHGMDVNWPPIGELIDVQTRTPFLRSGRIHRRL